MRVERDRAFADLALNAELRSAGLSRRDRALATELSYGTLRLRGRVDAALEQVLDRPLSRVEIPLRNLLRLGAYQVLCLSGIRDAAAVAESVELARDGGFERASGLVNAALRELVRRVDSISYPELEDDPVGYLRDYGSLPEWLAERWLDRFGADEAAALADKLTLTPPRSVRVSAGRDVDELAARLRGRRCTWAPRGLTDLGSDPLSDPGFARGDFTLQDEAAQLIPLLLGAREGDSVVDCCAAPGGKSVQLAEIVGPKGEVIALDAKRSRLSLIHRAAERLRLRNLRILERDVMKGLDLAGRQRFGRVLVDAPCSGLGVLRRNPDARWRIDADDIHRAAERQLQMLDSVARYVEEGGALVYSVCTMSPEETAQVTARFLDAHLEFRIDDPRPFLPGLAADLVDDDLALRTWPHRHGCDGFYAVRLVRA